MNKLLPILIFSGFAAIVTAQTKKLEADYNPCKVMFTVDSNSPMDHICHNYVKNKTAGKINLIWVREDVEVPAGWEPTVCDNTQCWATWVKRCPDEYVNNINKGESMLADVHCYDAGIDGSAYIKLRVIELEDTTQVLSIDYLFNKESVGTKNIQNISLRMYPNPTQERLFVDYNSGIKSLEICSSTGTSLLSYKTSPGKSYDISSLEQGIYFVKFIREDGRLFGTLKLQKL